MAKRERERNARPVLANGSLALGAVAALRLGAVALALLGLAIGARKVGDLANVGWELKEGRRSGDGWWCEMGGRRCWTVVVRHEERLRGRPACELFSKSSELRGLKSNPRMSFGGRELGLRPLSCQPAALPYSLADTHISGGKRDCSDKEEQYANLHFMFSR